MLQEQSRCIIMKTSRLDDIIFPVSATSVSVAENNLPGIGQNSAYLWPPCIYMHVNCV